MVRLLDCQRDIARVTDEFVYYLLLKLLDIEENSITPTEAKEIEIIVDDWNKKNDK